MNTPAQLVNFPAGTTPELPFYFGDKPAGHRAGWSCKWVTANGIVTPNQWAALESMNDIQIIVELQDLAARGTDGAGEQVTGYRRDAAIKYLHKAREFYPEFVYPMDPPAVAYNATNRPGWDAVQVKSAWRPFETNAQPRQRSI